MKMFFRVNQPPIVSPMVLSQPVNVNVVSNQEKKGVLQDSILMFKYGMFSRIVNVPGCSNCGK